MPRTPIAHSEPSSFFRLLFPVLSAWLFLVPALSLGGQTLYSASSQTNPLDNIPQAARSAGMGSAFTAVADDASALLSNPAGLGFLNRGQLSLNSDLWLVGTFQETALAGFPAGEAGGFGLAAHYLDYGSMEGRDNSGSLTSSYSANRLGLQAGWGYAFLKDWSLGVGFGGSQTTLAGTDYTHVTSKLGLLWQNGQGLRLGASYVNAGWISPGGASEDAVNLGASYDWALDRADRLLVAVGGSLEPNAVSYLQAGAEFSLQGQVFLRVGYQVPLSDEALGGLTDLTAGAGFHLSDFSLDYAFLPYGDLGVAHRVSIGYFFGNPKQEKAAYGSPAAFGSAKPPDVTSKENTATHPGSLNPALGMQGTGLPPATSSVKTGSGLTNTTGVGSNFPPLPSDSPIPSSSSNPGAAATAGSATTVSQPQTATAAMGPATAPSQPQTADSNSPKDSLVVQFDLPDNSSPSGAELEKEGKYKEAMSAYLDAVKQNPQDTASWWAMGNLYRKGGQKTYAIQCFEQVLKLQPSNQKLSDWLQNYKLQP